jgi:hypothetical protein
MCWSVGRCWQTVCTLNGHDATSRPIVMACLNTETQRSVAFRRTIHCLILCSPPDRSEKGASGGMKLRFDWIVFCRGKSTRSSSAPSSDCASCGNITLAIGLAKTRMLLSQLRTKHRLMLHVLRVNIRSCAPRQQPGSTNPQKGKRRGHTVGRRRLVVISNVQT